MNAGTAMQVQYHRKLDIVFYQVNFFHLGAPGIKRVVLVATWRQLRYSHH